MSGSAPAVKLQGYKAQLQVPISTVETSIVGLKEVDWEIKSETIDVTDHGNNGWKTSMNGLLSFSGTAKLDYVEGDSTQAALRTAILNSTALVATFLPQVLAASGALSYTGSVIITSFKHSGPNTGAQEVNVSFEGNGALTPGAQ